MNSRVFLFYVLLVLLPFFGAHAKSNKVKVVLLAGQSNMAGAGNYNALSDEDKARVKKAAEHVQLSTNGGDLQPLSYVYSAHQKKLRGFGEVFGPELFIGVTLTEAYPDQEFIFIKRAQGGTALYGAWNPEWDAAKSERVEAQEFKKKLHLCDEHEAQIKKICQRLTSEGRSYEIIGMAWMQGENDAAAQISACSYKTNLKKLVSRYREHFDVPYMPFVFGQINSNYGNFEAGPEMVRRQMVEAANEDPFMDIVRTKNDGKWTDFPKHEDQVHYTAIGQKRLGIAMGKKLIKINHSNFAKPNLRWEHAQRIDSGWLYLEKDATELPSEDDAQYQKINLPHTWNGKDVLQGFTYRRAASWYRKQLQFTQADLELRQYLRFQAAGQEAIVYVNGKKLGQHYGGYSAFTIELTGNIAVGKNQIDVRVSNADDKLVPPQSADFNFYGGLYRSVELISAPRLSFSRAYLGSNGLRIWSEHLNNEIADVHVSARINNGSHHADKVRVFAQLLSPDGKVVSQGVAKVKIAEGNDMLVPIPMLDVQHPLLWSPETPQLYTVKLVLKKGNTIIDRLEEKHGFRWFEFTADRGFFLNGKPYKLHGVNRHQDYAGEGNAVPLHRHLNDILLMKEMGINWLRLAHYQQDDYVLKLCDELGILVWEEIPYVNGTPKNDQFPLSAKSMMKDLINQHFNHPAIILWGMGNEVWMGDRGDGYATVYDLVDSLNTIIHTEDPVRKSVFVNGDNNRPIDFKVWEIPDVCAFNLYRGWYSPSYLSLTERVNDLHARMPGKPLIISEYGAGSDLRVHSETPQRQDFSIEYQNNFLRAHLDQFNKMPWLAGTNRWAFADFGSAHRGDTKPHLNQKGIVTYDRKKKDIFYLLKSRWTDEPVLFLESPSWTERSGAALKRYHAITNMDEVELFLNGASLGKQSAQFSWEVALTEGTNKLLAIGTKGDMLKEHGFTVSYSSQTPSYKVTTSAAQADAANLVDGDEKTIWVTDSITDIVIDLDRIRLVNGIKIKFDHNWVANMEYQLAIYTSVDGDTWEMQMEGKSNRRTELETFLFKKQQEVRYLKVKAIGYKVIKKSETHTITRIYEISPLVTLEKQELNLYEKIGAGLD